MKLKFFIFYFLLIIGSSSCTVVHSNDEKSDENIGNDPVFFPIGVWMQSPSNAAAYKANGINMYVGIWGGLDQLQLNLLKKEGMKVICDQDDFGLKNLGESAIYAWMHGDEPDNAQWNKAENKYDPCKDPAIIINSYYEIRKNDSSRPVYLNLGQGVAQINYIGRGACTGNTDSYKVSANGYLKGCDIASFDIYPVNNKDSETSGNLWYVAKGIDNLLEWSDHSKPVWCWIETTRIEDKSIREPTPSEVKSEVWMALIHGANGYGFFCHTFTTNPPSDEAAFLHDTEMISAMKGVNLQVASLARVLNSASTSGYATVSSKNAEITIDIMTKNLDGANYVFSVAMRPGQTTAVFNLTAGKKVEVLGENRIIDVKDGKFADDFSDYAVHLYKIK